MLPNISASQSNVTARIRRLTPLYDWLLTEAQCSGSETSTAVSRPVHALVRRRLILHCMWTKVPVSSHAVISGSDSQTVCRKRTYSVLSLVGILSSTYLAHSGRYSFERHHARVISFAPKKFIACQSSEVRLVGESRRVKVERYSN